MNPDAYNRLRSHVDFLESLLTVLVIALFVLAIFGIHDALVIALAVAIAAGLLGLHHQHRKLSRYACSNCGQSPHYKFDHRTGEHCDPATAHCLQCGQRLSQ
ncbi:hypothetical protein [Pseudomonas sp. PA27(2017)]|uniref:hypothetical protein n=1 Tax=Pseudomonas sp. PA27(2017) TaxID=1932112 RepID=UPI00096958E9|nr:hypothetical protein [Pseudomonas sp. PA27(2017)]OLU35682.1 hypothetical protein BVH06_02540 [Pseudomonas sp. PA27(2017)]